MAKNNYEEELKKERRLVCSLLYELDYRKQQLFGMEHKYNETTATLQGQIDHLIAEINFKDRSLRGWELRYNMTARQLMEKNSMLHEEIRKEKDENFKLKHELRLRTKELKECKSRNDNDLEHRSSLNEMEVAKENVPYQNLVELEKTMSEQIAGLKKELEETSESLTDMESRYSCLTLKHELTNRELQEARKESISGLNDILNSRTTLGVKTMGEIDQKAFKVACSQKFPNEDCQEISAKSCSLWQQNVQDPRWHPFKMINVRGNLQEIVDEDDEKLKVLRNEYGDVAFEAVSTALMEMNECNGSGRYPVPEIWNRREERKAAMKDIIEYMIRQLKIHKPKRKRVL